MTRLSPVQTVALAMGLTGAPVGIGCSGGGGIVGENICPKLTSWDVSPLQTSIGGTIDVAAAAADPSSPSDLLTFTWTPPANFSDPASAKTRYRCTESGVHAIAVTVSDNHGATPCTAAVSMDVTCTGQ